MSEAVTWRNLLKSPIETPDMTRDFDREFTALSHRPPSEDDSALHVRLMKGVELACHFQRWSVLARVAEELAEVERRIVGEPPVVVTTAFSRSPRTVIVIEDVEPETLEEQGIQ